MKKSILLLTGLFAFSAAIAADQPATPEADAKKQKALSETIALQLRALNVNQNEKFIIDFYFSTFHDMYAYRELLQWVKDLPETSPQRQDILGLVRVGLEAVVRDSGMGLPLTGWKGEGQPSGLLFARGLPRYTVAPDFANPATLKWGESTFDKQATPGAIGQSLGAKAQFILTDRSAEGKKLAQLLLQSALQEFETTQTSLFLGKQLGKAGAGTYVPAVVKLENGKWKATDERSYAYNQASLLQGLARLYEAVSSPAGASLTSDGKVGGKRLPDWQKDIRQTMNITLDAMLEHHFDAKQGSFVGEYDRQKGKGDRIAAEDAGYAIEALADVAAVLPGNDPIRQSAQKHAIAQAAYLLGKIGEAATSPSAFLVAKNTTSRGYVLTLSEQSQIITGLLAAERLNANPAYRKTALAILESLRKGLWAEKPGIFRSAAGQIVSGYDGRLFGLSLNMWHRLENIQEAKDARERGDAVIRVVMKEGALQQTESPATGEPPQPEAFLKTGLPEFVAKIAKLNPEEQSKEVLDMTKKVADQDGDGIPGIRFGGGKFGAVPVLIAQTGVPTPFEIPKPAADEKKETQSNTPEQK